ncbi:regucalcin-like [Frankliniella occidentalis]|uniref:Regucalcin n=1 Tax=Frankliniella occidentalis TaxID=133901 RepID=A0A9C6TZJ3_FRAOC|nr:regucalcin-like [Frankliniella occidentalis]
MTRALARAADGVARAISAVALCSCVQMALAQAQPQIQQVTPPSQHGEGPHWDCGQNMLYYVDISGQMLHRYDPATKDLKAVRFDGPVSPVVPVLGTLDQLVVGVGTDLVLVTVDWGAQGVEPHVNQTVTLLASVDRDKPDNRFNDGKADRAGRLWIGTMGPEPVVGQVTLGRGSLYRFQAANSSVRGSEHLEVEKVLSPVDISNGLAWNDIETLMYYIDTPSGRIDVFDFDPDKGTIANGRPAFDLRANNITGHPDGMTMDADGNLWVACFDGGQVIKVDPVAGRLLQQVPIPASRVTSVVFGGRDLSTLYVTTMNKGLSPEQLREQPAAGSVFAVTGLGTTGRRPGSRKAVVRR